MCGLTVFVDRKTGVVDDALTVAGGVAGIATGNQMRPSGEDSAAGCSVDSLCFDIGMEVQLGRC